MSGPDLPKQLADLADLHQHGLLSDEEFTAAKAALLGGTPTPAATASAPSPPPAATAPTAPHGAAPQANAPQATAQAPCPATDPTPAQAVPSRGRAESDAQASSEPTDVAAPAAQSAVPPPRTEVGRDAGTGARFPPQPPGRPAAPAGTGRGRRWVWLAIAVAAVVAAAVLVPVLVLRGHSSSGSGRSAAIGSSAGSASAAAGTSAPAPIGGSVTIWLTGNPGNPAPSQTLPASFAALLQQFGVAYQVHTVAADTFDDEYARAQATGSLPDIMAGPNSTPFDNLTGESSGIVSAYGPIESVDNHSGFVYLPRDSPNHAIAVRLATSGDACAQAPATKTRPSRGSSAVAFTLDAITEWATDPAAAKSLGGFGSYGGAISGIQSLTPCFEEGNGRIRLESVSVTTSGSRSVGVSLLTVLLVHTGSGWTMFSMTGTAVPSDLVAAVGRVQPGPASSGPALPSGFAFTLLDPPDGVDPPPTADNTQDFDWSLTSPTGQVLGVYTELAPEGFLSYWVQTKQTGNHMQAAIGNSGWNAAVHWRAVAILRDGTILFSPERSYPT